MFEATQYVGIYHHGMMALVLLTALIYSQGVSKIDAAVSYNSGMLWGFTAFVILLLGTRPISSAFIDMPVYAAAFNASAFRGDPGYHDWGFNFLMSTCSQLVTVESFFLICIILYIMPVVAGMRKAHGEWGFAVFLALAGSTSFFSYGVNGIRNGLATSLLLAAFAFWDRKLVAILLMLAAEGMHKSALLPIIAFLAAAAYPHPWLFAGIWAGALGLSMTLGERLSAIVSNLAIFGEDERLSNYTGAWMGTGDDKGGFRWDFILYSIVPVMISHALATPATRKDLGYRRLLCTYLLSNAVWIIIIYASQSNRFAYLSWFMMPWVIIYPFVPGQRLAGAPADPGRLALLGAALVAHYVFTYVMVVFVYANRGGF